MTSKRLWIVPALRLSSAWDRGMLLGVAVKRSLITRRSNGTTRGAGYDAHRQEEPVSPVRRQRCEVRCCSPVRLVRRRVVDPLLAWAVAGANEKHADRCSQPRDEWGPRHVNSPRGGDIRLVSAVRIHSDHLANRGSPRSSNPERTASPSRGPPVGRTWR